MPPKNLTSPFVPRSSKRTVFYRGCSLSMALLCLMDALDAVPLRSSSRAEEPSATWVGQEHEASFAEGRRLFDTTVRPRVRALLALSANELGQRECSAPTPKEPVRGRIDRAVVLAAGEQLTLPMGSGSVLTVAGQPYLFCLEPHYHPPEGGVTPEGWHKGVTVYHAQLTNERRL